MINNALLYILLYPAEIYKLFCSDTKQIIKHVLRNWFCIELFMYR